MLQTRLGRFLPGPRSPRTAATARQLPRIRRDVETLDLRLRTPSAAVCMLLRSPLPVRLLGSKGRVKRVQRRAMAMFSKECCDKGTDWEGTPSGTETKMAGLEVYVAKPKQDTKAAVLYLTDVHTWEAKNARLFADKLAADGFLTIVPDFFHRDYPHMKDLLSLPFWKERHPDARVMREAEAVLAELRDQHGITTAAALGFCWGGKYSVLLAGKPAVQASATCHGALITKDNVRDMKAATLFLFSDNDPLLGADFRHWIEGVLKEKKDNDGIPTDSHFYPGQAHGWTQRGDDKDPVVAAAAADAYQRVAAFFREHLL